MGVRLRMPHPLQLTLAVLKPDLLIRPSAAREVKDMITREGFHIVRSDVVRWSVEDAQRFYEEHRGERREREDHENRASSRAIQWSCVEHLFFFFFFIFADKIGNKTTIKNRK